MNIEMPRRQAENLFRHPEAESGSNAAKLVTIRKRLQLRQREQRSSERVARQEMRITKPGLA